MIPAIIGALGSIGATVLNNHLQKNASDRSYSLQRDYSTYLLKNQTQQHVADARRAGLNPAFMNGSQLGSTPAPPSYDTPSYQVPDFSSLFLLGKQIADTRKTNAEARAQELANADKEARNKVLGSEQSVTYTDSNNVPISDLDSWLAQHPNELPNQLVVSSIGKDGSEGRFTAEQDKRRWKSEVNSLDTQDIRNNLEQLVTEGQINNPKVLQALEQMPLRTYNKLLQDTSNAFKLGLKYDKENAILDIEKVTKQLEQDIMRDSNLSQYVEKIFNGTFEVKDLVKLLVMAAVKGLGK